MNAGPFDVEAYVRHGDVTAVLRPLSITLGPLERIASAEPWPQVHRRGDVRVVLQPTEDGFLAVWVRGSDAWPSCAALGRQLARELQCVVRCDPGDTLPGVDAQAGVLLEMDGAGERFVILG